MWCVSLGLPLFWKIGTLSFIQQLIARHILALPAGGQVHWNGINSSKTVNTGGGGVAGGACVEMTLS